MSKEKKTYLYLGPAYRQEPTTKKYYHLATDDKGKPVSHKMYCSAVSDKQASNFFKLRLRNRYGHGDPIILNKKYMYVKEVTTNEEK